jgi:adenylate cyclase class 2
MSEIEVKVLGVDVDEVARRLEALGATCLFDGRVNCVHFDHPDHSIRKKKSLFRLRRWKADGAGENKFEICVKGPKTIVDGCKVREEFETTVADADMFETMMTFIGYERTMNNDKRRRSYEWNGLHFDLDEYPTVPAYMEIEAPDRAGIDRAVAALKLDEFEDFEISTETANELFERLWPEVDFDQLRFE